MLLAFYFASDFFQPLFFSHYRYVHSAFSFQKFTHSYLIPTVRCYISAVIIMSHDFMIFFFLFMRNKNKNLLLFAVCYAEARRNVSFFFILCFKRKFDDGDLDVLFHRSAFNVVQQ